MMNQKLLACVSASLFLLSSGTLAASEKTKGGKHTHKSKSAHVHGVAELDVAIDGNRLSIIFESPMDSVVGFEHKPKSKEEIQKVDDAVKVFNEKILEVFTVSDTAKCVVTKNKVETDWDDQGKDHDDKHESHADLEVDAVFTCEGGFKDAELTVNTFSFFSKMGSVKYQLISDKGQHGGKATKTKNKIKLK